MIAYRLRFDLSGLERRFNRARRAFKDLRPEMKQVGAWVVEDARKRLAARGSKYMRGRLAKSLKEHPYQQAVTISSVQPYARIQQEGGTVRPRKSNGYLAIPLQDREKRNHAWPRHWSSPLVFIQARDGRKYLLSTKFQQLVYVLVKQVRIPGRPYLVKSAELIRYMRTLIANKLRQL